MLPAFVPPIASSGRPVGPLDGWVVEPKADGWRAQVAVDRDSGMVVRTRTGRDITAAMPELVALTALGVDCVLDGEVVAGAGLPACEELHMEGVVVKRRRGPYRPGKRSPDWRKVKCAAWRAEHAERRVKK